MKKTEKIIKRLKKEGFYNNWTKNKMGPITFFIYPNLNTDKNWFKKRLSVYRKNAKILTIKKLPKVNFFVYPSKEEGKKIGIIPAICFIKKGEIHGHINQSPGHELTHILIGKINSSENLPGNGLLTEGLCTYLNGTKTNQKRHTLSLNISKSIFKTPWLKWKKNAPGELYPLFGSIIQYLVKVYGWKKILSFLKKLKNEGQNDTGAASKVFKKSMEEIQKDWLGWIKK